MIEDRPGRIEGPPGTPVTVRWLLSDESLVSVSTTGRPDSIDVAPLVARSVVADEMAGCETSLRFGWLPPGVETAGTGYRSEAGILVGRAGRGVETRRRPRAGNRALGTRLDTLIDTIENRELVRLRDRLGTYKKSGRNANLAVPVDGGRWLVVSYQGMSVGEDVRTNVFRITDDLRTARTPITVGSAVDNGVSGR